MLEQVLAFDAKTWAAKSISVTKSRAPSASFSLVNNVAKQLLNAEEQRGKHQQTALLPSHPLVQCVQHVEDSSTLRLDLSATSECVPLTYSEAMVIIERGG